MPLDVGMMEDMDVPFRVSPSEEKIIEHCPMVQRGLQNGSLGSHVP